MCGSPADHAAKLNINTAKQGGHIDAQISLFDEDAFNRGILSFEDFRAILYVSQATMKNWIRLGKIVPDIENRFFSLEYAKNFIASLESPENTTLKKRRNKKLSGGKILYKNYIHTPENQKTVEELLRLDVIQSEHDLRDLTVVLASFAVQLFYQSRNIQYSRENVLFDFLTNSDFDDFRILIEDLLKSASGFSIEDFLNDRALFNRLKPALEKEIRFSKDEDTLGFIYISLKDLKLRKQAGTYYTPEKVVNELIDDIERLFASGNEDLKNAEICDPCCGSGNFLLKLAVKKNVDLKNLYGQDIDVVSVCLARINLALLSSEICVGELKEKIIAGNSYFHSFKNERRFDIVLGNPPWGSDLPDEESKKCRKIFTVCADKNTESYDLFIEKALSSMLNENGILAFVLPEAVLTVESHSRARKLISESCSFKFVSYLGNVFSNVQCPAIILGIRKDNFNTAVGCNVFINGKTFTAKKERKFNENVFYFNVSDEENDCLDAICAIENAVFLKDNAKFALGIVTGNNKDLIAKQKYDGYETILKGSDVFRYGIKKPQNYIKFAPESFQQTAPSELYRAKEKLIYRFICEVPVFAYDNRQTLTLNSCNILIPNISDLKIKYILAILNSSAASFFVAKKFKSIKLLRSHIEKIPIPNVSCELQENIIKQVNQITDFGNFEESESRSKSETKNLFDLYSDLDNAIMNLYNLSASQKQIVKKSSAGKNNFLKSNR